MSASQYLLEIGTEELPVGFLLSAPTELVDKVRASFQEHAIGHGEIKTYVTPRRLTLHILDIAEQQADRTLSIKGPPLRVALDAEGKPTPAGLGFARKVGVEFSDLSQETLEGETYLVLHQAQPGRPVKTLLPELLPNLVLGLSGSHFMAWSHHTVRFSRPLRWLVSLWNNEHVPLSIGPVASGTHTHGHRVLSQGPIDIVDAAQYLRQLEEQGAVLADPVRRKALIWEQLQQAAQATGGTVLPNDDLLNTVTLLVEHPSVVTGRFEERFLDIPAEVTTTVMTAHQKYFPVRGTSGELRPFFLTVSNGRPQAADTIRLGNEKVITARLEDARFFFNDDQKIPLEARLDDLKGITFQKGLGSLFEKTQRLEALTEQIAIALHQDDATCQAAKRAARLAKADLVTGMVFEFTELQGEMGRKYALLQNESPQVADAIFEHYLPRHAEDQVAKSPAGIAVSLADKLDTIVAVFSQHNAKLPSGSKDPLGLRRMASGIIQTVLENQLRLDLSWFVRAAYRQVVATIPQDAVPAQPASGGKPAKKATPVFQDEETTLALVQQFFLQRFRGMLLEQDNRYDLIDAALEADQNPLSDLHGVLERITGLKQLTADPERLQAVYEPANRIYKILGAHYNAGAELGHVQPDLLKEPAEHALFAKMRTLADDLLSDDLQKRQAGWTHLTAPIDLFFETVMVNDPDEAVRKNRYNLLSVLNRSYLGLACFTRLVV